MTNCRRFAAKEISDEIVLSQPREWEGNVRITLHWYVGSSFFFFVAHVNFVYDLLDYCRSILSMVGGGEQNEELNLMGMNSDDEQV